MKYSTNWLTTQIENGVQPEYLFFWGHTQKITSVIDKSCFSQWWPAEFTAEGVTYPTAEHWMMAKKAMLFEDNAVFEQILQCGDPAKAKQLGRSVKNFDGALWESKAYQIVVEGNYHKFNQSAPLKEFLLKTGTAIITEASPVDAVWGIGLAADNKAASNPLEWKGKNLLGFALMEVREALKN